MCTPHTFTDCYVFERREEKKTTKSEEQLVVAKQGNNSNTASDDWPSPPSHRLAIHTILILFFPSAVYTTHGIHAHLSSSRSVYIDRSPVGATSVRVSDSNAHVYEFSGESAISQFIYRCLVYAR